MEEGYFQGVPVTGYKQENAPLYFHGLEMEAGEDFPNPSTYDMGISPI